MYGPYGMRELEGIPHAPITENGTEIFNKNYISRLSVIFSILFFLACDNTDTPSSELSLTHHFNCKTLSDESVFVVDSDFVLIL